MEANRGSPTELSLSSQPQQRPSPQSLLRSSLAGILVLLGAVHGGTAIAQSAGDESLEDSTVVFEADFFDQFQPVSVNDMIDRIPGIGLALGRGGGGGRACP